MSDQKKVPINLTKIKPIQKMVKKPEEKNVSMPAWGKLNQTETINTKQFSLLDVMNEEMKNLKLAPALNVSPEKPEPKSSVAKLQATKGWNFSGKQDSHNSIANIIEMEKRSKDQYKILTNRPLNVIQMEEAAIERLKKYYDIENVTDISIKIEFIDEIDFKECAPVWKTKKN